MDLKQYIRLVPDWPKKGVEFKDIQPLLNSPDAMSYTLNGLIDVCWDWEFNKIAAFDARGFLFGTLLQMVFEVGLISIRKRGKLPPPTVSVSYNLEYGSNTLEIGCDSITKGDRVLMVDDLLATGGTMEAGCWLVEKLGGVVAGCVFVVELVGLEGRLNLAGYDVRSIVKYEY